MLKPNSCPKQRITATSLLDMLSTCLTCQFHFLNKLTHDLPKPFKWRSFTAHQPSIMSMSHLKLSLKLSKQLLALFFRSDPLCSCCISVLFFSGGPHWHTTLSRQMARTGTPLLHVCFAIIQRCDNTGHFCAFGRCSPLLAL